MKSPIFLIIAVAVVFASCKKDNNTVAQTFYGKALALGGDSVRSFVNINADGQPTEIGIQLGENALNNLPKDTMPGMPDYMYVLSLPTQGKISGIDHIEVDWNPYGHEPSGIYSVPHFDFHFYYITASEQSAVVPGPDTVKVASQYIPKDYFSTMNAVPDMGTHWIDSTSDEFHGKAFTATFIYGFYRGKMTFLEPMVTKVFLLTHPNFSAGIKQPAAYQQSNYYPATYNAKYDADKHVYFVTLSGLNKK